MSLILVSGVDEFVFAQENSWEVLPSMTISRSDYTGVAVDTKIYLIQGIGAENNFTVFDTSTELYTELAPVPYFAHHSASAMFNGKIFVAGGCNFGHSCPTAVVYDIASNKWASLPAMPIPTWAATAEIVNNEFFVMGGSPNEKTCQKYNITINSWSICADLPTGREHLSSAVYDNKIYVINGRGGGSGDSIANEVYDPVTNSWKILADKPTGMAGGSGGIFKNKIFVIGGEGSLTGANEWYDPVNDSWTSGPEMPTPRHGLVCEPSGSKIYCFGGGAVEGGGKSAVVEVFDTNSFFGKMIEHEIPTQINPPSLEIVVTPSSTQVPDWIKQNAKWWAQGAIDDSDFVSGIQYLIKEGIMTIPETAKAESGDGSKEIPSWIKNNAGWWAQGLISDDDFVKGIQFLVEQGIIVV